MNNISRSSMTRRRIGEYILQVASLYDTSYISTTNEKTIDLSEEEVSEVDCCMQTNTNITCPPSLPEPLSNEQNMQGSNTSNLTYYPNTGTNTYEDILSNLTTLPTTPPRLVRQTNELR